MSGISISHYETIGDAPEERWRTATQGRYTCAPEWFAMLEANRIGFDRRYTLADAPGEDLHGALCSYLFDAPGFLRQHPLRLLTEEEFVVAVLEYLPAEEHAAIRAAIADLTGAGLYRTAVSTSPFRHQHAMPADDPKLLPALIAELENNAERWDCPSSAVLYVDAREHALREALTQAGYIGWICGARCELPITYSSIDEYVKAKKGPIQVRREINRFKESGITVSRTPIPEDTTEHARLAGLLEKKLGHGYHPDEHNNVLQSFRKFIGEHCFVVSGSRDGELVGYVVVFRDRDDTWRVGMPGWDDSRLKHNDYAYFNIMFYELIEMAIREGIKTIDYQLEAYKAKVNRGCTPWPLWCFMKVTERHRPTLQQVADAHLRGMREMFGNHFSVPPKFLQSL